MAFNGNGTFVRLHNWTSDAANNIDINAGEMDAEDNGFAAGLTNCVTRDGQGKMAADFVPSVASLYNLGTAAAPWESLNGLAIANFVVYPQTAAEAAASITPTNRQYPAGDVRRYGADPTGVADSTSAIANAILICRTANGANARSVFFADGTYKVSSTITVAGNFGFDGLQLLGYRALINFTQNGPCFTIDSHDVNGTAPNNFMNVFVKGIDLVGPGYLSNTSAVGWNLLGDSHVTAHVYITDSVVQQCQQGILTTGAVSCYFDNVTAENNNIGYSFQQNAQSSPNNMILRNCAAFYNIQALIANNFPNGEINLYAPDFEGNNSQNPLIFTGALSAGATSATLLTNFLGSTGVYNVTFSTTEVRAVTLTHNATTATWAAALSNNETANAVFAGNLGDGTQICVFTLAGEVSVFGGHFEGNVGTDGLYFSGNDATKTVSLHGVEMIPTCTNVLNVANGYACIHGGRIFNAGATNNTYLNSATSYAIILGCNTLVTGTGAANALWAAQGGFSQGAAGQGSAGGSFVGLTPPSNVLLKGQSNTITLQYNNAAATEIAYQQMLNAADSAFVTLQSFGWVFYANNTKIMYIGRGAAASIEPGADNTQSCGSGALRWSVIYAASGSINTSDERIKQDIAEVDLKVLKAWGRVKYSQFRYIDAVKTKGDKARIHMGLIAQRVKEAFEAEGLDAFAYGLLCFDSWEHAEEEVRYAEPVIVDGVVIHKAGDPTGEKRVIHEKGERYGIRYEEALALECAYLRSKLGA